MARQAKSRLRTNFTPYMPNWCNRKSATIGKKRGGISHWNPERQDPRGREQRRQPHHTGASHGIFDHLARTGATGHHRHDDPQGRSL